MKLYANTKFEIGQTVYRVYETRKNIEQKVTCDLCLGTGKITYKGYKCNCPKCNGRGELVTDSKEVTLREIDVPRKVTAIRLIADKNKDGLLRYTLDAPQGYCSSKGALEKNYLLLSKKLRHIVMKKLLMMRVKSLLWKFVKDIE